MTFLMIFQKLSNYLDLKNDCSNPCNLRVMTFSKFFKEFRYKISQNLKFLSLIVRLCQGTPLNCEFPENINLFFSTKFEIPAFVVGAVRVF